MPEYTYADPAGHVVTILHPASTIALVQCAPCACVMHRRYSAPRINWGGLKPSAGELHPRMKRLIDGAPARREQYAQEHEDD